jgi:hypothetical protein
MMVKLTLAGLALLLLASCNTRMAGGEFAMPVWAPQVTNAVFAVDGPRSASVTLDWRTGQAPFTVHVEMPGDFEQVSPIETAERSILVSGLDFMVPEGTSGLHTYTVTLQIRDALGQVTEREVDADFNFPPAN